LRLFLLSPESEIKRSDKHTYRNGNGFIAAELEIWFCFVGVFGKNVTICSNRELFTCPSDTERGMNDTSTGVEIRKVTVLLLLVGAMLTQCGQPPAEPVESQEKYTETISCNGYLIPLFSSAEAQLRYARSRFSDPDERRAALEMVIKRFPEGKAVRAEADLEMAYLKLGMDHRFADRNTCMQALDAYRRIITRFPDIPEICAKAHWYMGWIHADLLNQKREAITHYRTVYRCYPEARLKIESPVTWVVLVMPQIKTEIKTVDKQKDRYWASRALLEIIRNSVREKEREAAFQALWSNYRTSLATGYALCALLNGSAPVSPEAIRCASAYIEEQNPCQPLTDEIRRGLIGRKPSMQ
jgi:hypothetical protein